MRFSIREESPLGHDVRVLIARLNETLLALTPAEYCYHMTAEEMAAEDTTVFVARDGDGVAIAMGALRRHSGGIGEVKRMFTDPKFRGKGIGRNLLRAVEDRARADGLSGLVLETGDGGYQAAWKIYEEAGFVRCGPVLDYTDTGYSVFYKMTLEPQAARGEGRADRRGA